MSAFDAVRPKGVHRFASPARATTRLRADVDLAVKDLTVDGRAYRYLDYARAVRHWVGDHERPGDETSPHLFPLGGAGSEVPGAVHAP